MKMLAGFIVAMVLGGVAFGQDMARASAEVAAAGAGKRPMTFTDLQRFKRIDDPQVSPDGRWVMFSAVDVDLAANTKVSHLWIVPLKGGQEKQVTFWKDDNYNVNKYKQTR